MSFEHYIHSKLFEANKKIPNWEQLIQDEEELGIAVELLHRIEDLDPEGEALIVGGAVRDLIIGKEIHDVDIATNIDLSLIEREFRTNDIGKSKDFGIFLTHYKGYQFEIAAYRTEKGYSDNRRPDEVTLVKDFQSDAARRDLTINAMGIDKNGVVYDYFGGIEDIQNKRIRTVGDPKDRFGEDALRVLRAPRFASSLGFDLSDEVKAAMHQYPMDKISKERIVEELKKAAASGSTLAHFIELLDETDILSSILPDVAKLKGLKQNPEHHPEADDTFGHVMCALRASPSNNPLSNLALLFHDIGKGRTYENIPGTDYGTYYGHDKIGAEMIRKEIGPSLKLSKKNTEAIAAAAELHMLAHKLDILSPKKILKLVDNPNWDIVKDVMYADELCRQHLADEQQYLDKVANAEELARQRGSAEERKIKIKQFIDGNKLMQWIPELQQTENKHYMAQILNQTGDWIVENEFNVTEDDVKQYVMNIYDSIANPNTFKEFWVKQNNA
jgi:tRNA nucleotidyltransferase/poly(A) polymerase